MTSDNNAAARTIFERMQSVVKCGAGDACFSELDPEGGVGCHYGTIGRDPPHAARWVQPLGDFWFRKNLGLARAPMARVDMIRYLNELARADTYCCPQCLKRLSAVLHAALMPRKGRDRAKHRDAFVAQSNDVFDWARSRGRGPAADRAAGTSSDKVASQDDFYSRQKKLAVRTFFGSLVPRGLRFDNAREFFKSWDLEIPPPPDWNQQWIPPAEKRRRKANGCWVPQWRGAWLQPGWTPHPLLSRLNVFEYNGKAFGYVRAPASYL